MIIIDRRCIVLNIKVNDEYYYLTIGMYRLLDLTVICQTKCKSTKNNRSAKKKLSPMFLEKGAFETLNPIPFFVKVSFEKHIAAVLEEDFETSKDKIVKDFIEFARDGSNIKIVDTLNSWELKRGLQLVSLGY